MLGVWQSRKCQMGVGNKSEVEEGNKTRAHLDSTGEAVCSRNPIAHLGKRRQ